MSQTAAWFIVGFVIGTLFGFALASYTILWIRSSVIRMFHQSPKGR